MAREERPRIAEHDSRMKKKKDNKSGVTDQIVTNLEGIRDAIVSSIDAGIIVYDRDFCILFWNPFMESLSGMKAEEVVGKNAFDLFPHLREQKVDVLFKQALEGNVVHAPDVPFRSPLTGRTGWSRSTYSPYKDSAGSISGVVAMVQDITDHKLADDELKKSELKYKALFEHASDYMIVWGFTDDDEPVIVDANKAASSMHGYSHEEFIGKRMHEIDKGLTKEQAQKTIERIMKGETLLFETAHARKDGSVFSVEVSAKAADFDGNIKRLIAIERDITERKKMEGNRDLLQEQLARAERMESLAVLSGGVAHDLNNTMGPMVLLPDLIMDEIHELFPENSPEKGEIEDSLSVMRSAAERAAVVVRDLVALSRRGQYQRVAVDINKLACTQPGCSCVDDAKMSHPKVSVIHKKSRGELMIMGASDHLCRVIRNLVSNGVESIKGEGTVTVSTYKKKLKEEHNGYMTIPSGQYAVIEVTDTGKGIAKKNVHKIFEPFFSKKDKTERSGSGLGLSVVHGVISDHEGYIDVITKLGQGTTFALYFDLVSKVDKDQKSGDEVEDIAGGAERILVVDDEAGQRYLAKKGLKKLGYTVHEVEEGRAAVDLFKKATKKAKNNSPYDLVVLDMVMEDGFDGLDTLNEILRYYPEQKVIIATGHAESDRSRAALDLGAGWLPKPYRMIDLSKAVRTKLDKV